MKAGSEAQWSLRRIGQLAWTSIPLAIVMTLNSLSGNIPRYFVGAHMGERELGIFMAMAYLMVVPGTIMSAFFQSTSPRLSKLDAESKELAFRALVRRLTVTGALVGAAGIVVALFASPGILTLLYRPEYAKQPDVLVWLMVAAGVQCVGGAFSVATTSLRQFWVQAPVEALSVIITVTVVAASVPRWGLVGAAWALLAASGLSRACVYVLLRSRLDRRWTQG